MDPLSDIRRATEVTAPRPVDRQADAPGGRSRPADGREGVARTDGETRSSGERSVQSAIARASRALGALDPGADGDVGARLDAVRDQLVRAAVKGDQRANALLERLDALVFSPGRDGGAALAVLTQDASLARQLALLASAAVAGVDQPAVAQEALAARLLTAVGAGPLDAAAVGGSLTPALADLFAASGSVIGKLDPASAATQLRSLRSELLGALAARLTRGQHGQLAELFNALAQERGALPMVDGALARVMFTYAQTGGAVAPRARAFLDALLAGSLASAADVAGALVAESGRSSTALRDAIGRHIAAREFEHAWNVARREFGDPVAFGFAVPDGPEHYATVQLVGDEESDEQRRGGRGGGGSFHLTLGVDFSALGPIRADLAVRDDQVAVRLVVAEPRVAMEIRRRVHELETLLGCEGRRVLLAVADGTEAEATVDARRVGVHDEDHVMDLEG